MLYIGLGLLAVFVGMVLLTGMEMVISRIAQHLGVPLTGRSQNLFYIAVRGLAYLPLSGLVAWMIYLFTTPPRRRYWIALGITTAILISPAGLWVFGISFLLLLIILRIPIGG
ncbi:MAG: hypothetical protein ACK4Z4_01035 [Ferrovibrio sp.]